MKLVVFDVDGTLIDSQHHIYSAMSQAVTSVGLPELPMQSVLGIVGLSLPVAIGRLAPEADAETQARIVENYKYAFQSDRNMGEAPLYPGAMDCLDALSARNDLLLAVATGKSRRGLTTLIEAYGLEGRFVSLQTCDDNPSKPDPAMLQAAMAEAGVEATQTVMVGDTTFDMEMARAAGAAGFGVSWGYHAADTLHQAGAKLVVDDFPALTTAILEWAA